MPSVARTTASAANAAVSQPPRDGGELEVRLLRGCVRCEARHPVEPARGAALLGGVEGQRRPEAGAVVLRVGEAEALRHDANHRVRPAVELDLRAHQWAAAVKALPQPVAHDRHGVVARPADAGCDLPMVSHTIPI